MVSGADETAMAYKAIHQVMAAQQDLGEVIATFYPEIMHLFETNSIWKCFN